MYDEIANGVDVLLVCVLDQSCMPNTINSSVHHETTARVITGEINEKQIRPVGILNIDDYRVARELPHTTIVEPYIRVPAAFS